MSENEENQGDEVENQTGENESLESSGVESNVDLADAWGEALAEQGEVNSVDSVVDTAQEFAPATYEEVRQEEGLGPGVQDDVNLDVILDIPVTLSMEIGRTKISIRNLLQLNQGSVVELDRLAGDSMDVLVNGTLIAHGEVVVVNDKFGIRLTDVISPAERVRRLR